MRVAVAFVAVLVMVVAFVVPWLVAILAGLPPQGGENAGLVAVIAAAVVLVSGMLVRTTSVLETTARYDAAPERVYALFADPRALPRWSPPLASVELTGEPGAAGARYVARNHGGRAQHGEVLLAEPPSRLLVRIRLGRARNRVEIEVDRRLVATPDGTEVHTRRVVRCSVVAQALLRLQARATENLRLWQVDRLGEELARTEAGVTVP